jgi:hypothetical protein
VWFLHLFWLLFSFPCFCQCRKAPKNKAITINKCVWTFRLCNSVILH